MFLRSKNGVLQRDELKKKFLSPKQFIRYEQFWSFITQGQKTYWCAYEEIYYTAILVFTQILGREVDQKYAEFTKAVKAS